VHYKLFKGDKKMSKKRNLILIFLLVLGVLLISGCWLISTPTYTITYDGNGHTGGSVPTDSTVYKENDTVTILDKGDLVKTGYTFAGWNTQADGSGTDHAVGSTFIIGASDVTLYAKWAINSYTVTFNSQGGSAVSSQTVNHGGKVSKPTDPTKTGYAFAGWYKESGCTNAWDFATDTVTSNITLYAKWTPLYALRDTGPAGGLIFYVKEGGYSDGWMYLEAAPASTEWTGKQWGSYGTLIGGTGTGIGTGQSNTTIIVNWLNSNTDNTYGDVTNKTDRAAYLCDALTLDGYSDWFLPSKDELNLMYTNLHNIVTPVGGFADRYYWSSSEDSAGIAWYQYFGNGSQYDDDEGSSGRVRAVRAF